MARHELKALLFDFDGTLADTLAVSLLAYNQLAPAHGMRPLRNEDLPRVRQMGTSEFIKFSGVSRMRIPRILAEGKTLVSGFMENVQPIDGIAQVLPRLRERFEVMGIITSNSKDNVRTFLRAHNMEHFEFISSVPKLSGKAKHIRAAMKLFTLMEGQVAYFGDETRDIKAARKAKVFAGAVTWGFNSRSALSAREPDMVVESPAELLGLIDGIHKG